VSYNLARERPDVVYWSAEKSARSGIFYLGFLGLLYYASYKMTQSLMDRGLSKSYPTSEFKSDTTFKDIFGLEKPRAELQEIIDYLRTPEKHEIYSCCLKYLGIIRLGLG
jgi:ATP-dependent Zn protease